MKAYPLLLAVLLIAACHKKSSSVVALPSGPGANTGLSTVQNPPPIVDVRPAGTFPYFDTFRGIMTHAMMYPIVTHDTFIEMYVKRLTPTTFRISNMITEPQPVGISYTDIFTVNDSGFYPTWINSYYKLRKDSLFYSIFFKHGPDYERWDFAGKKKK